MRKKIGISILVVSVMAGIYLTCFWGRPARYSQCIVDNEQFEDIMTGREKADDLLDALNFNEETLFWDQNSRTFYYSLIEGDALAYDPMVDLQSGYTDTKLAFLQKQITQEQIQQNQPIYFIAYTDEKYCDYYLKCTTLPLMNIIREESDSREEILDDPVSVRIKVFDNQREASARFVSSDAMIRIRGGSTRGYPKRGYRLTLTQESLGNHTRDNDMPLLGMRQDEDWVLYAAYNDQEKIRNVFSCNLWKYTCAADNARRIDTGVEYKYLELFLDGQYWGLYALGYPIDSKQLQVDAANGREALYETVMWADGRRAEATGGNAYEAKDVSSDNKDPFRLLYKYYNDMLLYSDDNERLYAGIDMDNAIDTYLFFNLIQGSDNVDVNLVKNQFLIIRTEEDGRLSGLYIPWDMDISWGNLWEAQARLFTVPYAIPADANYVMESGYLNQLILNEDDAVWEKIFSKYRNLREEAWSEENINAMLDKYEADIYHSGAYLRDMERWPEGIYSDPADGLDTFRRYVLERLRETDVYYDRLSKLCGESVFVRRSAQYKDFEQCCFIIEINDKERLNDEEYTALFAYMGIDTAAVTENVHFIIANPAEKKYDYLSSLTDDVESSVGTLSFTEIRDGVYETALEGTICYDTTVFSKPDVRMVMIRDKTVQDFSFEKGYGMQSAPDAFMKLSQYIDGLSVTEYHAVIEVNTPEVWQNQEYRSAFEKLGLPAVSINQTTDFIVWNGADKAVLALDNFHISGSRSETPAGGLSLFENEDGIYGVYLDNEELFQDLDAERTQNSFRVLLLEPDSHEIVEEVIF